MVMRLMGVLRMMIFSMTRMTKVNCVEGGRAWWRDGGGRGLEPWPYAESEEKEKE